MVFCWLLAGRAAETDTIWNIKNLFELGLILIAFGISWGICCALDKVINGALYKNLFKTKQIQTNNGIVKLIKLALVVYSAYSACKNYGNDSMTIMIVVVVLVVVLFIQNRLLKKF